MPILDRAARYMAHPFLDAPSKATLKSLLEKARLGDERAYLVLSDAFLTSLTFGTGGLRAKMGFGTAKMNVPNVRRATIALGQVMRALAPHQTNAVVGLDSRLQSREFAEEAAKTLSALGYTVYYEDRFLPTPFLCFAMKKLNAACGVIITASHNPREYNGFKAYNHLAGQLVFPEDQKIEAVMNALPDIPEPLRSEASCLLPFPPPLFDAFYEMSLSVLVHPKPFTPARILYAAMHGTGSAMVPALFLRAGIPLIECAAQAMPDGNFPTAPRPNPEEMRAFQAPMAEANRHDCEAIVATDPDADRLGVLYKKEGVWHKLSGNDMAALALDYLAAHQKISGTVCTTVVTSDFLSHVASLYALPVLKTLTGFKHVGAAMRRLEAYGERFAFAAEESIGFLPVGALYDKDGVTAALLFAEMIGHYKARGMGLDEAIGALKARTAPYATCLLSLEDASPSGKTRFSKAMQALRKRDDFAFPHEKIIAKEDYQQGFRVDAKGQRSPLQDREDDPLKSTAIPKSNVLKLIGEKGSFAAYRPSGTEPKLKIYLQSMQGEAHLAKMVEEVQHDLNCA